MTGDLIVTCRTNKQHYPVLATQQIAYVLIDIAPVPAADRPSMPLNLCLVLDHSGSMVGERLDGLKQGVKLVLGQLTPRDTVSLVIFDDRTKVVIPSQPAFDIDRLKALVDGIKDGGGTHLSGGLELGLIEVCKAVGPGVVSRILLLTDGQTWGDEARCIELATEAGRLGVPITALGLGVDFNHALLDQIATQSGPGGMTDWIEQPPEIAPFFEWIVRPMQATDVTHATLTLRMSQSIVPRQIWQVLPIISNLGQRPISERDVQVTLGDLNQREGRQLLVELLMPPRQPGTVRIAQAEVTYDVPLANLNDQRERADIVVSFTTDQALSTTNDPAIIAIVERVTAFRLQTQALQDVDSGNIAGATSKLRQAATRLLTMGEDDLAKTMVREADHLEQTHGLSEAGTKQLTYSGQRLAAAPGAPSIGQVESQPRSAGQPSWSPTVMAPIMPPPASGARAKDLAADTDTIDRYPDISLPEKTVLNQPCALRVAVTQQPAQERFRELRMGLVVPREQEQTILDVLVTAAGFEIIGDTYQPLVVPRDTDSDPLVFQLIPRAEGEKTVKVEFFHESRYVGGVTMSTTVIPSRPLLQPADSIAQGRITVVPGALAPDLTLLISEGRDETGRMAYQFKLHAPALGLYFYPIKDRLTFPGSPASWMEGLYTELSTFTEATGRDQVAETLRTIGADLYEKLFPRELKELWSRRIRGRVSSIMIISDEPWIPWEIIRPSHETENGTTVEDGFLCETYLLARWIAGPPPPSEIRVTAGAVIAPDQSDLRHANEEVKFLRTSLGPVTDIDPHVAAVWTLLKMGGVQLIHFVCHGQFDPQKHEQSTLYLEDHDQLKARDIAGERRNFGKNRPFVFLNACQTARADVSLVGIGSWAEKFIGAESGGFLGSSWDVTDSLAARFSQSFYRALLEGKTIGEAVQRARLDVREDGDPTWLAYTLYADPLARAVFATSLAPHLKTAVCPACSSVERPEARFCSHCGQPLRAAGA